MWRLNLERTPTPLPPPHPLSAVAHSFRSSPSISPPLPLNLFVISSQTLPPILASNIYDFLKSTLSVFPPLAHSYIPNFAHSLFLPLSIETLYFYVVVSTSLRYLPSFFFFFFARSYAIFCYAWRIHLACGRSGSDGYISPGGSLVSGEWLASPVHSGLCAC